MAVGSDLPIFAHVQVIPKLASHNYVSRLCGLGSQRFDWRCDYCKRRKGSRACKAFRQVSYDSMPTVEQAPTYKDVVEFYARRAGVAR
jgi:hypothetical protein